MLTPDNAHALATSRLKRARADVRAKSWRSAHLHYIEAAKAFEIDRLHAEATKARARAAECLMRWTQTASPEAIAAHNAQT